MGLAKASKHDIISLGELRQFSLNEIRQKQGVHGIINHAVSCVLSLWEQK